MGGRRLKAREGSISKARKTFCAQNIKGERAVLGNIFTLFASTQIHKYKCKRIKQKKYFANMISNINMKYQLNLYTNSTFDHVKLTSTNVEQFFNIFLPDKYREAMLPYVKYLYTFIAPPYNLLSKPFLTPEMNCLNS